MERVTGILAILVGVCVVAVIGVKIRRHRRELRELVHLVGDGDRKLVADLEEMVQTGELAPAR